jgi:hypothetical protein
MLHTYTAPVANLLSYEQCQPVGADEWPDYVSALGLTKAHIPELLTLMQDVYLYEWDPEKDPPLPTDLDPDLLWCGPIHAWRTLGQLRAVEFLEGALTVLQSPMKEWAMEEFPDICQLIGPEVVDPLGEIIQANIDTDNDVAPLIESLSLVPEKYPEERDRCVAILSAALERYPEISNHHNTFLVLALQDLKATEAVDTLEAVYQSKRIDEMFCGTWAYTQIKLGLKTEDDFTEAELTPEIPPEMQKVRELLFALQQQRKPDAFELGMPMDPSAFPSTKPPEFQELLNTNADEHHGTQKGFGTASQTNKKGKKKKK